MQEKKDVDLTKLLKEYTRLQSDLAKVKTQLYLTTKKENVENSISNFTNYIRETAKRYGQNIIDARDDYSNKDEEIEIVKQAYVEGIKKIQEIYDSQYKNILKGKLIFEAKEMMIYRDYNNAKYDFMKNDQEFQEKKDELVKLAQEGKLDELEEKTRALKQEAVQRQAEKEKIERRERQEEKRLQLITLEKERYDQMLEKCKEEMAEQIDFQTALRDEKFHNVNERYLVVMKQRNALARAVGWVWNKINGKNRFKAEVIEPLKKGVEDLIDNKIPKLQEKITNQSKTLISNVEDKKQETKEKSSKYYEYAKEKYGNVKEISINGYKKIETAVTYAKDKAKEYVIDKPKEKFNNVIGYFSEKKDKIVDGMISSLKASGREVPMKNQEKEQENERQ